MLAIATRLVAALALGGKLYFADEAVYLDAARRLLAGEGYAAAYANVPAYPVILAALAAPWPASVLLVRCAQALVAGAGAALLVAPGFGEHEGVLRAIEGEDVARPEIAGRTAGGRIEGIG